ncbi:unnamed protein product, partial [Aphanomyces euteiches]
RICPSLAPFGGLACTRRWHVSSHRVAYVRPSRPPHTHRLRYRASTSHWSCGNQSAWTSFLDCPV